MAVWGDQLRRRIVYRAARSGNLEAARVAAHDETWAAASAELRPKYEAFRRKRGKRSRGWLEVLKAFIAEYWDDILRILLALLPLILEHET